MENAFKRFLSLAMAILMVVSNIPTAAFASEVEGECLHTSVQINSTATCTEAGETITSCLLCEEILSAVEAEATGHNYVDGVCENCEEADPDAVMVVQDDAPVLDAEPEEEGEPEEEPEVEPEQGVIEEETPVLGNEGETEGEPEGTPVPCTLSEGCTKEAGHDGDCVTGEPEVVEEVTYVAMIGEQGYETLAAAIAAAEAGETITFVADITEDVTVSKKLTIDGAGKTYTGNISVKGSTVDVTVKNVNFVGGTGYAITTNTTKSITVENCTVENYGYGFLYSNKATPTVVVKNVTVENCNYGFHYVYGSTATLENVTMTNVVNGLYIQNYASKTVTLKNCTISSIAIWERSGYSGVQTFNFEGNNTVDALEGSQYAKYILAAEDATLNAPEGATVTTNVDGEAAKYVDGKYVAVLPIVYVAQIGEQGYETLSAAIAAAEAGATIELIADVTEDVTVNKDLTIDGANFNYTGNISVKGSTVDAIVKNVNFVGGTGYAITTNTIKSITVENCTAKNYGYGFLYANKSTPAVVVKNVKVEDCNYGFRWVYGSTATLENVTMTDVMYGLDIQNYAAKTIDLKNCTISSIAVQERENASAVQTFNFEGANTVGTLSDSQYAKYILAAGATLIAPSDVTVITDVAGYVVKYANGKYIVVEDKDYVAQIGEQYYETLAAAIAAAEAGATIELIADVTEDVTVNKDLTIDGAGKSYTGNISVKGSTVDAIVKNVNFVGGTGYAITTNTIKSITVENCTAKGYGYGFLYANKSTPTVVIKNVKVDGGSYGFRWVYGSTATLENVTMTDVMYGLDIQNYAAKTIDLENCTISSIAVQERENASAVQTFNFEGANTVGTLYAGQYAKYILTDKDATLSAPEGATVATTVADREVAHIDGVYKVVPIVRVAKIGETEYRTLSAAIAAAQAGDTITFLTNITEDVTVNKDLTIDGAGKSYTGNISVKGSTVDAIVKNVNFVGGTGYAITTNTIKSITVENCTAKNYGYGFLYANKSTPAVVVKNVKVEDCNYGFRWVYGSTATLENVTMTDVMYGLDIQNYAAKTIDLKNCTISSIAVQERENASAVQTFNFEGANTVGTLSDSQYAKYILTDKDATLNAPEGATVATTVADREVAHIDGVYKVVPIVRVAKIGETEYRTLSAAIAAAQAGDTITFLTDITEDVTVNKDLTIDGAGKSYTGNISVKGSTVDATVKNVNFVGGTGYAITTNTIKSITVENCTAKGYGYGFLYANKSTPAVVVKNVTVENCNYGFRWVYGSTATLENVTMTDVVYGLDIQNYAAKTINLKNCDISSIAVQERENASAVQTFNFEGANTVGTLYAGQYAKYILTAEKATLTAPEDATVTTTVADREVAHIDGVYKVVPIVRVAKIGETEYKTLAAAIAAAKAGDTIELIADVTENVTVNKSVTIDGAGKTYTGNILVSGSTVAATIKNVNFVNGSEYAIKTNGIKSITVENCTAKGYGYGFLYANKSTPTVVVKNVTVENCNYGFHYVYGSTATLENVTMTDVVYGLDIQNYAAKTINLKNCDISSIAVQERENASAVQTFNFAGANTVGTLSDSQYAKYILTAKDATLNAPEGATVATTVDGHEVERIEGVYKVVPIVRVAQIGETQYKTLAAAIAAAKAGDTITFLTDITEDVTVNKSVTIDGAGKTYTGNILVSGSTVAATIKNVNFVNGSEYAIKTNGIKSITVENCTAKNYGYGFLYANKSTPTVVVKNVKVEDCNYGFRWVYGSTATLENVTMTDVVYGLDIQNYAAKTINLKNCDISSIAVQERENASAVQTFNFAGANTVGTLSDSQYAKYILTAEDATLSAPEGATVATTVDGHEVERIEGVYKVVPIVRVAQIGETQYKTLAAAIAAAQAGDTIVLLADITEDVTVNKDLTIDGANFNYTGNISVKGSTVDATVKNVNFVGGTGYAITTNTIKSITVENCTAKNYDYGFLYANKSTPTVVVKNVTVENCNYGFHYVYGSTATLENVTMTNVVNGLYIQNYASKTVTLKNCTISSIAIWERSGYSAVQTFNFAGANTVGTLSDSQYAKYVLTAENATLSAPEGATVTTTVEEREVAHIDGVYKVVPIVRVAKIGETQYKTLAAAIAAAKAGDTIELIADVTENVIVDKDLTINGANFNYTGNISVEGSTVDAIVKNVNFVDGTGYAITTNRIKSITVENCTAKNYGYGFLYANKSTPTVVVKNVTVENCNYGFHYVYGTTATLENVTMTNVTNGIMTQNYGAKTITIRNCDINATKAIHVWERNATVVDTFIFEGENTLSNLTESAQAKLILTADAETTEEAILTTSEVEGLNIISGVADYKVVYETDAYKLVKMNYVAQIGEDKFETLAEAFNAAKDGDTITMIADHVMDGSKATTDSIYGYDNLIVNGKSITLDFAGYTVEVTPNCVDANGGIAGTLESIVFLTNDATLTLKDETGKGGIHIKEGTDLYSMIYNNGSTLVIENGNYYVEKTIIKGSIIYADKDQETTINGGVFTLKNAGEDTDSTKPWIVNVEGKNESFVKINGGCFNDNPYKNYGTQKDCEVKIPDATVFKQLTEGEYEGYWGLVNAVAWNVNTTVTYSTLDEALAAAKAGETVAALANITEAGYATIVPAGVTLDLNGKNVTAKNLLAFGNVIDSTQGKGGIKISNDKAEAFTQLQATNAHMPLYDAKEGCYRFYKYQLSVQTVAVNNGVVTFKFRLRIMGLEAYKLLADDANSGVKVSAVISWTGLDHDLIYQLNAAEIAQYANEAYQQVNSGAGTLENMSKQMLLKISGLDNLQSGDQITCLPGVSSDTGFVKQATSISTNKTEYTIS